MPLPMFAAALVATLVGFGSTIALVLAAGAALGATGPEMASWVAAISVGKGAGSILLSTWSRVPVVLAWSTPGAALIAGSTGFGMGDAVGAFVAAGLLMALTGALPQLTRAVSRIPQTIAAAMLAGVLLPFCLALVQAAAGTPGLVLPLVAVFVAVRLVSPLYAVLAALGLGLGLAAAQGGALPPLVFDAQPFVFIAPAFTVPALLGLGVPLALVTMASQNLPGFAVLKGAGYTAPVARALGVTGAGSALAALFGAHTFSMAAITAAICLAPEVHPDPARRWRVGLVYGALWIALGLAGSLVVPVIMALPAALIAAIAGLALIAPMSAAAATALTPEATRFPAAATLIVTASGVSAFGIGAAFWGLAAGLALLALDRLRRP